MGAWGYGIYDNDSALDILSDFEGYGRTKTVEEMINIFIKDEYYKQNNECLLVMADKCMKNNLKIPFDILSVIQEEITGACHYRNPDKRTHILQAFQYEVFNYGIKSIL